MVDERDTGEHFIGPIGDESELNVQISARRVADLASQIEFLDREIARYRELLETERIRHATEIADLQLKTDTEIDQLRREERLETQALHDSYRTLMNERQIEHEQALSKAAASSAAAVGNERERYDQLLARERSRRDVLLEAGRNQAVEELSESHQQSRQGLVNELLQAATTIERLEHDLLSARARAVAAEQRFAEAREQAVTAQSQLDAIEQQQAAEIHDLRAQLDTAHQRTDAERKRSAATLAELLERSASIAAEADRVRSELAAERAKAAHVLATAEQRASEDYHALATAADERAANGLAREIELEGVIADLRARLTASQSPPKYCEEGDNASTS